MIKMMPRSYEFLDLLAAEYAKKYKRMAIVASQMEVNTSSDGNLPLFTKAFEKLGGQIVLTEEFPTDLSDFRSLLLKLRTSKAQAVIPFIWAKQLADFMRQADQQKLWSKIDLAGNFVFEFGYTDLVKLYPEIAHLEGLLSVNFKQTTSKEFITEYKLRFNSEPPQFSDYAYDVIRMIQRCGFEKACLLQPAQGASGRNSFDETGRRIGEFALKELRSGVFVERVAQN
jgi:ABC-type branched-subunit amino acid transport system substrate-binding protein